MPTIDRKLRTRAGRTQIPPQIAAAFHVGCGVNHLKPGEFEALWEKWGAKWYRQNPDKWDRSWAQHYGFEPPTR